MYSDSEGIYQGYEAGMGGGWLDKCSPVLHYIAGIRWKPSKKKESCMSVVSFKMTL